MSKDDLGDYLKSEYEKPETERRFPRQAPIYVRLDGRAFSNFTRRLQAEKPFDGSLTWKMIGLARHLVVRTGARIAYTQSDEISLILYEPDLSKTLFFDGRVQKLTSVLAGMASGCFNRMFSPDEVHRASIDQMPPVFDCRAFSVPNREEAAKVILWRQKDCVKNAITLIASKHYSHDKLMGMSTRDRVSAIEQAGDSLCNYPIENRQGVFLRQETVRRELTQEELARIPAQYQPTEPIERSEINSYSLPVISNLSNPTEFLFDQAPAVIEMKLDPVEP